MFRRLHFAVTHNAGVALPRQTDLLAVKLDDRYLVECKWRARPVDIADLDSLRSRLGRTTADVVGVLISMSGFGSEAIEAVRHERKQPILLISSDELRSIEASPALLLDLLYRKREALVRDAHVLVDEPRRTHRSTPLPYPESPRRFRTLSNDESGLTDFAGGFTAVVFVDSVTDVDWTTSLGHGVSLDIRLPTENESGIVEALDTLVDLGWVTDDGRWSIQQQRREWHGLGMQSLMEALPQWQHRADHHSEQVAYVDNCDGGFYSLMAYIDADKRRRTRTANLSFQLDGAPLDLTPWQQLSRTLGVHEGLRVRPHDELAVHAVRVADRSVPVTVRGWIVEDDWVSDDNGDAWAVGVVVNNPFVRGSTNLSKIDAPDGTEALGESDALICSLRHHHPVDEVQDRYYLSRLEWAWTADVLVCAPQVDWPDRRLRDVDIAPRGH